ncbi:hypothetical protein AIOL_000949 [Candidatus Rhodobacter oscarellae]|uniref:Uncharacterized protein n=2 Tax=Candidatus Rhodobacter oscarellae TaxID=1675527 RepID=A0A0J9EGJ1_9RHOB|nr:hypothetical protein AIOL_000949 [Candidatus Rhodobacter lobularis]
MHIEIAERALASAAGVAVAPDGLEQEWIEALTVRALASVFPWLNTFALDGAAKVGRLEGSVEYRFLDADEVEAKVKGLMCRFEELVAKVTPADPADETPDQASADTAWLGAI